MGQTAISIPNDCDVVVIGGGPAGSSSATLLAKSGYHVILLEKLKHPRPAVGESIIVWDGEIRQVKFSNFGFTSRAGLHVERDLWDHLLLRHSTECGAQVFEEVMV